MDFTAGKLYFKTWRKGIEAVAALQFLDGTGLMREN